MTKQRLALIYGGKSSEHDVSIRSATEVLGAVDRDRFEPVPIAVTREGRFKTGSPSDGLAKLVSDGEDVHELATLLRSCDCVFPLLHGPHGEDGTFQGMFEVFGVPYVGSGVLASSMCMDKVAFKHHVSAAPHEIPVTPGVCLDVVLEGHEHALARAHGAARELGYPIFVKPANQGSSVGVSRADDLAELDAALALALRYDTQVIVERGLDAREIELAVLGDGGPDTIVSLPGEIILPKGQWYTYESKYIDDVATYAIPVELPPATTELLQAFALRAFRATRCAGLARVDFLVERDSLTPWLNEVNTMPGFTTISMYPKMMGAMGIGYTQLITRLVDLGIAAHQRRTALATTRSSRGARRPFAFFKSGGHVDIVFKGLVGR
jgi:D-alanine-D-alanine ligase